MALMKLGIVATDIRRSVGGTTFSRNAGGAYTRARVAPINRNTPKQSAVRASFGTNAKAWSQTLTAAQRAAWTFFAQANPSVNVLGASIILSGLSMYQRLNRVLAQIGYATVSDPPADLSVPMLSPAYSAAADSTAQTVTVVTDTQITESGAGYYIFATGNLAAGKKPGTSDYRFIGYYGSVITMNAVDISAKWLAVFGAVSLGSSIGVSVATVNNLSGATTPSLIFNTVAT